MAEAPAWQVGLTLAGPVVGSTLDVLPAAPPDGRSRHIYGAGPFAGLRMPPLPALPGIYVWAAAERLLYVGQTTGRLRSRLGSNGYSTISTYNTLARQPGRSNGGQQTNCRINALANAHLRDGGTLDLWYRVAAADESHLAEAVFMRAHGLPPWNRRDHR